MTSDVTKNYAAEWDALPLASTGVSHRSTTSSRLPGKSIEGNVLYEMRRVIRCPDCGGMRRDLGGPHGPRLDSHNHLIDCIGRPIGGPTP